jgi:phage-related protein
VAHHSEPQKIPLIFYRTTAGSEPVREWLRGLDQVERHAIGKDLLRTQWRWPVGMPLCRPMGSGLWEVRTDLSAKRTARVLLCLCRAHLVALHGFIKKLLPAKRRAEEGRRRQAMGFTQRSCGNREKSESLECTSP